MAAQMEACKKRASILDKAAPDLSKLLAIDDDFLRELVARDVITGEQREIIENIQTNGKKVDKLLGIIKRTTGAFDGFMELLNCDKTTDLYTVMKKLEDNAGLNRDDMAALLEAHTKKASVLDKAAPDLSKFLAIDEAFLRELVARDVITDEEKETIESIRINSKKVDKLLGIIKRTTGAYNGFMKLLNCDKRRDLYNRMTELEDKVGLEDEVKQDPTPARTATGTIPKKRHNLSKTNEEQDPAPGTSTLYNTRPTKKPKLSTTKEKQDPAPASRSATGTIPKKRHNLSKTNEEESLEYWREQLVKTYLSMPQNTMRLLPDMPEEYQDIEEGFVELGMTRQDTDMEGIKVETYAKLVDLKDSKGKQCKRVLVDGKPGMGKSTLIKRLAYQWAKTFTESPYELVFVLKMNTFKPEMNLVNAIQTQLLSKVVKQDLELYLTSHSESILVLLDGYDEVKRMYRESKSGDINDLLCNRWLHESCVVITTRSNHVSTFKDSYSCDAHVQLHGLDDDDKLQEYSNKYFMTESFDQSKKLLKHLKSNSNLREISQIPAICAMLCLLWKRNKTLPTTISSIYREVVLCMATYRLKNYDEERVMKLIAEIGEIALQGVLEDNLVFKAKQFDSDILDCACQLGLVTTMKLIPPKRLRSEQTVEFLHKTFQEMSAALYLVNLVKTGNLESCLSWLNKIDFIHPENIHQMICFCCGLSDTTTTVIFFLKHIVESIFNRRKELDMLMESHFKRDMPLHWGAGVSQILSLNSEAIRLPIDALYEFGNDREDMQEVFHAMTPLFNCDGCDIEYYINSVPSEIVYFFHGMVKYNLLQTHTKYLRMTSSLDDIDVKLIEDVVKCLPNVNHLILTVTGHITNWPSITLQVGKHIGSLQVGKHIGSLQVGKHIGSLKNLSHCRFDTRRYSPECHEYFYNGLLQTANAMKIRDVTLSILQFGKSCTEFVSKLQNLQRFQLIADIFTPPGNVTQVLKSITSPFLEVLDLRDITVDKDSITHIPCIKTLQELHLTYNNMDRECCLTLFDVLRTSTRLLKLTLSRPTMYLGRPSKEHVKELCTCLCSLLSLQELSLEGNHIGSNLPLLTNQLKSMPNLSVLNLKNCNLCPHDPSSGSALTEFFRSFVDAPALQQVTFTPRMKPQSCKSPFLKKCFEELEKDGCTTIVVERARARFAQPVDTWRIEPEGIKCIVDTVNNFDFDN